MIDHSGKRFPQPSLETEVYWQGCREHRLLIQKCTICSQFQFYPRIMCSHCMSKDMEWTQASGRGKVASYTIIHRAISKAYQDEVPYVVALVELEEGPTMMSNIIHCDPQEVAIGMEVEVKFEEWSENVTIPKFLPRKSYEAHFIFSI